MHYFFRFVSRYLIISAGGGVLFTGTGLAQTGLAFNSVVRQQDQLGLLMRASRVESLSVRFGKFPISSSGIISEDWRNHTLGLPVGR